MTATIQALVVDDSKSARYSMKKMLQKQNIDICFAESAGDALNILESRTPDIIFMDHLMPGMDGFEATRAIKGNPKTADIPVIMCTSREGEAYRDEAMANGAADIISKPAPEERLVEILTTYSRSAPTFELVAGEDESKAKPTPVPTPEPVQAPAIDASIHTAVETYLNERQPEMLEQMSAQISSNNLTEIESALREHRQELDSSLNNRFERMQVQLESGHENTLVESAKSLHSQLHQSLTHDIGQLIEENIKHSVRAEFYEQAEEYGLASLSSDQLHHDIAEKVRHSIEEQMTQQIKSLLSQQEQQLQSHFTEQFQHKTRQTQLLSFASLACGLVAITLAVIF
ncbi:response regulator [Parendozoicomonas haliclonae]|uniref:Response regulator PleD n=1 Tax=Parendozoicomonas haliclonae TaxID=1960125 RepID=A0A1X7ALQ1_9GAMM|nr:response regulator [Parendozoicomonas haliclonae]SMA49014.1 Response regulator PleD [Parendozoicomonas haliclonae]